MDIDHSLSPADDYDHLLVAARVIMNLGIMDVIVAGWAFNLCVVWTPDLKKISFPQLLQDQGVYGEVFNEPDVIAQAS